MHKRVMVPITQCGEGVPVVIADGSGPALHAATTEHVCARCESVLARLPTRAAAPIVVIKCFACGTLNGFVAEAGQDEHIGGHGEAPRPNVRAW